MRRRLTGALSAAAPSALSAVAAVVALAALAGCMAVGREGEQPAAEVEALVVPGISRELASHRVERISDLRYDLFFSIPGPATAEAADRRAPITGTARIELALAFTDGAVQPGRGVPVHTVASGAATEDLWGPVDTEATAPDSPS